MELKFSQTVYTQEYLKLENSFVEHKACHTRDRTRSTERSGSRHSD